VIDRRQEILQRIAAILVECGAGLGIPPDRVFRNRGDVPPPSRPAMVLMDGSEMVTLTKRTTRGGPASSIVRMLPEIFVLMKERPMTDVEQYGPEIANYRNVIYNSILYDAQLFNLMGDNGGMEFRGFETDMESGRLMRGELLLRFWFHYPLIPSELL
jgi:hypothetical protein